MLSLSASRRCKRFNLYRQIAIGVCHVIVASTSPNLLLLTSSSDWPSLSAVYQFLRVCALYGRDYRVVVLMVLAAAATVVLGAVCTWSA